MKRTPLARRTPLSRSTKPLPRYTRLAKEGKRGIQRAKEYAAFLRSEAWQAIRLATLLFFDFTCQRCGWRDHSERGLNLDCHHINRYRKPLGSEIAGVDTTLRCRACHRQEHWYHGRAS